MWMSEHMINKSNSFIEIGLVCVVYINRYKPISIYLQGQTRKTGWIEGGSIIAAVLIVSIVNAVNDYTKVS